jgi:hypothetical protein
LSCFAAEGRKAEFPFGAEPRADDVFVDAADADFRASALFAVCFFRCFHDKWVVSIFLFRPAGFYAGQRGRRSFRLRKHNLAFLKPLSLSDAVVQFPPVPLSGLADYSDKGDPAGRMSFSGDSAGLLYGRSDSHLRPCKTALVDYLAAGTKTDQIGSCLASCLVVVKEGVNHRMPGEKRDGFGQVDDRVQNRGVDAQSFGVFQREISEEIHISFEGDNRSDTVIAFEGFMDFLAYLSLKHPERLRIDAAVLNSVVNLPKAVPFLSRHPVIHTFFDNDEAGRKATADLIRLCPRSEVIDQSSFTRT